MSDLEGAIAGATLQYGATAVEVTRALNARYFVNPRAREVLAAARRLFKAGYPIDTLTVADELGARRLEAVGGLGQLADFAGDAPVPSMLPGYVKRVRAQLEERASRADVPRLIDVDYGTFSQRLLGEREERIAQASKLIPFEIPFFDDQLAGLMPTDLVVLTARPGAGKTQLASTVCESAARAGRRATGIFLEAVPREAERRIKYRTLARFFADEVAPVMRRRGEPAVQLSYRDWMLGRLDRWLFDLEAPVERWLNEQLGDRLRTVYRGAGFGLDELERVMVETQDDTDMFVVDHLHFLDLDDERQENAAITAIMKRLRELTQEMGKPVLLVAHLRKADRFRPSLVPVLDEIQGTGNITKIATSVMTLAPAEAEAGAEWWSSPTYMRVLKDRLDGDQGYTARVAYDRRAGVYAPTYELGRIRRNAKGADEWQQVEDHERPPWATHAAGQRRLELVTP